jgi:NitT/TauT family transport system ATP-binding protein
MAKIIVKNLYKRFLMNRESVEIIRDINLEIENEVITSIVGVSGCGKTSLLKLVAGLIPPSFGEVKIESESGEPKGKDNIGFVFQSPALFPWLTVYKNIAFPLELSNYKKDKNHKREVVENLLDLVGLWDFRDYLPEQISIGMQQRVSIARALSTNPSLLLMDEPFSSLDEFTRDNLNDELLRIQEQLHPTVLFVTHSLQEALYLSKKVIVLSERPAIVKKIIEVPLPYPRTLSIKTSSSFIKMLEELNSLLKFRNQIKENHQNLKLLQKAPF